MMAATATAVVAAAAAREQTAAAAAALAAPFSSAPQDNAALAAPFSSAPQDNAALTAPSASAPTATAATASTALADLTALTAQTTPATSRGSRLQEGLTNDVARRVAAVADPAEDGSASPLARLLADAPDALRLLATVAGRLAVLHAAARSGRVPALTTEVSRASAALGQGGPFVAKPIDAGRTDSSQRGGRGGVLLAGQDGLAVRVAVELVMQWGITAHLPDAVQRLPLVAQSPLDPASGSARWRRHARADVWHGRSCCLATLGAWRRRQRKTHATGACTASSHVWPR